MAFIYLSFILIYGNQAALNLVARDKELSAWSEQRPHGVDLFGGLSCWIRDTWYHTNNLPVRTCMFTVRLFSCKGKESLN